MALLAPVVLAAWALLPANPVSAVLLLLLNTLAVVTLVVGVRRHRPAARAPWLVLLGAQVCSVGAFTLWYLVPSVTGGLLPVPSPVDGLFLALYTGNCAAVGLLIRREQGARAQGVLHDTELSLAVKLISVAYPALDLVLVVLVLRRAFGSSRFTPAKVLLLAWAALQLTGDVAYGVLALGGRWTLGSPVFLLWMAGFACLAAAAVHPSMADLGVQSRTANRSAGQTRRLFVAVAVLVLPAVVTVRLVQGSRRTSVSSARRRCWSPCWRSRGARSYATAPRATRRADRPATHLGTGRCPTGRSYSEFPRFCTPPDPAAHVAPETVVHPGQGPDTTVGAEASSCDEWVTG